MKNLLIFVLLMNPILSYAKKVEIDIWTRQKGDHSSASFAVKKAKMDISSLGREALQRKDIQYTEVRKYKGVFLRRLINAYNPNPQDIDAVLLHFRNGMIIPVRVDLMPKAPAILIALKIFDKGKWTAKFPNSVKNITGAKDNRPIVFDGNKVVISEQWAVKTDYKGNRLFTPWKYIDSLVGMEFIQSDSYYRQFRRKDGKDPMQGFTVYVTRCQFCHGVKKIGASFGVDFVNPTPLYKRKDIESLFSHVKVPKHPRVQANLAMPRQIDVKKDEIRNLWFWNKKVSEGPLLPYSL